MAFKLVVELRVINEAGEIVDKRGLPCSDDTRNLRTVQDFREYVHIDNAFEGLYKLNGLIKHVRDA